MFDRTQIKARAKESFKANYWPCVGALVLVMLIMAAAGGLSAFFIGIAAVIILATLYVGLAGFMLKVYRGESTGVGDVFSIAFSQNYGRKLGGILWMELFVYLWSLLFVIPGIIKAIAYSMTPYILAECPNVPAQQALKLSMRMTKGHKGEIFVFYLSFIGWMLLSALTLHILMIFYVGPYMYTSMSGVYDELKRIALESGAVSAEELS